MNKNAKEQLEKIIKNYVFKSKELCDALKEKCKKNNLLIALQQKEIERNGSFNYKGEKITFSFHGVGCTFESESLELDLDFGTNGKAGGFDLWRIQRYIHENNQFKNSVFMNSDILKQTFDTLIKNKEIIHQENSFSSHLYYFVNDIEKND